VQSLLSIENLNVRFTTQEGVALAVRDLSFGVGTGEALGLVGESGCGKSVTALALMRLIPDPPGQILGGKVFFDDRDIMSLPDKAVRDLRGNEIAMIFQEPMTSLNPIHTCGDQIMEPLILHKGLGKKEARARALELLTITGIPSPSRRLGEYPHQLSGGMRQRVMIAMALACKPKLLIADEPTTALDVTIQAQILELMKELRRETGSAIILITHDLGIISEMCDRVAVMYAGQVVETCLVDELFKGPLHPYSEALLFSIPAIGSRRDRLYAIKGTVPSPFDMPPGCAFAPRCDYAREECLAVSPALSPPRGEDPAGRGRLVRCHFPRIAETGAGDAAAGAAAGSPSGGKEFCYG
jgi:oligopeptide/dipeptide ABC transporter ATP-binding protein